MNSKRQKRQIWSVKPLYKLLKAFLALHCSIVPVIYIHKTPTRKKSVYIHDEIFLMKYIETFNSIFFLYKFKYILSECL